MREKLKRWREEKALKKKMDAQEKAKKKPFIIKHAVPTEKINPSAVKREVADPSKVRWFLRLPLILRWNVYVDKIFIDQYFDDFNDNFKLFYANSLIISLWFNKFALDFKFSQNQTLCHSNQNLKIRKQEQTNLQLSPKNKAALLCRKNQMQRR